MLSDVYQLGKRHYWEGLPVTAMDHATPDAKLSWLSGWLDAHLERKTISMLAKKKAA